VREIEFQLEIENFSASNGWLDRFCKQNNLHFNILCGESAAADLQAAEDCKYKLPSLTSEYAEEDIFKADESGVFYCQLPMQSFIEKVETCKGGKKLKERILFCCAAMHREKN
jgi:hypothetical protein